MPKEEAPNILKGELCPMCNKKTLTLSEGSTEVPYFGVCYVFSMTCETCKYHKADLEAEEKHPAAKFTYEISKEEDMKIRVVKSSKATVKLPHLGSIEPGESSNGYISNIEGILNRMKQQIEFVRDTEEDETAKKKAKNMLKKINKIIWGQEKQKIIIEDPSGNSAIISDKAIKAKLK